MRDTSNKETNDRPTVPRSVVRRKVAFVLAGGGSLGSVQVGMLRALVEAGVTPDLIVGSSVGAINAAYFAANSSLEGISRLEELWRRIRRSDVFPVGWRNILGLLARRDHLVSCEALRRLIDTHLAGQRIEASQVPLRVMATDVLSGQAVTLKEGETTRAVLASCAIPAAFAPVEIGGRLLCDGAVASNTPVVAAVEEGARRIIVLPTGFACAPERPPRGALESALHAITLLTARQLTSDLARLAPGISYHILPTACPQGISPFDFSRAEELISQAHAASRRWIEQGGLDRSEIPVALRPHLHVESNARRKWRRRRASELTGLPFAAPHAAAAGG